ncbi:unnamed protein product [Cuscuta epithymum]|uniref:Uncharacterized protein n=1 Tax=Cuscuta epithymum TaxID=186058 RepID=A0AAV0EC99_9ASTE|nr:unnamed protein product [Cuscuta epithymum]
MVSEQSLPGGRESESSIISEQQQSVTMEEVYMTPRMEKSFDNMEGIIEEMKAEVKDHCSAIKKMAANMAVSIAAMSEQLRSRRRPSESRSAQVSSPHRSTLPASFPRSQSRFSSSESLTSSSWPLPSPSPIPSTRSQMSIQSPAQPSTSPVDSHLSPYSSSSQVDSLSCSQVSWPKSSSSLLSSPQVVSPILQTSSQTLVSSSQMSSQWLTSFRRSLNSKLLSPSSSQSRTAPLSAQVSSPGTALLKMNSELKPAEPSIMEPAPDVYPIHHEGSKTPERDTDGIRACKVKDQPSRKLEEGKVTDKTQEKRIQALAWKSDHDEMTIGPDVFVPPTGLNPLMYQSQSFLPGTGIGAFSLGTVSPKPGQSAPRVPNGEGSKELIASTTFSAIYGIPYTFLETKDDYIQPTGRPPDNPEGAENVEANSSSFSKPTLLEETSVEVAQGLSEVLMKSVLVGGSLLVVDLITADLKTSDRTVLSTHIDSASMIPSLLHMDCEKRRLGGVAKAIALGGHASFQDEVTASIGLDIKHKLAIALWNITGIGEGCVGGNWQVRAEVRHVALASSTKLVGLAGDDSNGRNRDIGHDSLLPMLGQLNEPEKLSMMRNATWNLLNFCLGKPPTPFALIKVVLPVLQPFIHMREEEVWNEVCWLTSNITAGSRYQIKPRIETYIITPLVHLFQNEEVDIKEEAANAIHKATSGGSHNQIRCWASNGCIKMLSNLFFCQDPRIVTAYLEGLENIWKVEQGDKVVGLNSGVKLYVQMADNFEGLDKTANFQIRDNNELYEKAGKTLEKCWSEEVRRKGQVLKLKIQKSTMYWEGRGARMKMKWKIKAVSYHPP